MDLRPLRVGGEVTMTAPDEPAATPQEWAHHYATLGWRVLPIKPGEKRPPMTSWQHAATTDRRTIDNWYRGLYRDHGVGIATGRASGIFVLDVDTHGHDGQATLDELEWTHGPLPATVEAVTGSDGRHLLFAYPPLEGGAKIGTTKGLGPGLDVRGDGGQIVACPTIHPNGTAYRWRTGHEPGTITVAEAPEWLQALVTVPPAPEQPPAPERAPAAKSGTDPANPESIAEWVNRQHRWADVLYADGWQVSHQRGDETHWTRPGKTNGTSAVLHGDGPLVVFTTSVPALQQPWARGDGDTWAYSLFGYVAATRHNGDRSETARAYRLALNADQAQIVTLRGSQQAANLLDGTDDAENGDEFAAMLIDWPTFWAKDHSDAEWIAEPLIALGRSHAIFAPGGTGKSLLTLWLAVQIATGGTGLTGEKLTPRHVLYLDYEMTEDDLAERLDAMGYGDQVLDHLHYALLPTIAPLDAPEGGRTVARLAEHVGAELVVIDTYGRAVEGDENDADTTRAFYRWTGIHLKAAGRAFIRVDHAGKDTSKGQRGSSAKNDDVDVVWQMTATDGGFLLEAKKRRMGWVPETVTIGQHDEPHLHYRTAVDAWPAGTSRVAALLDELGVSIDTSARKAAAVLREAGHTVRNEVVRKAVKYRKSAPFNSVDNPPETVGRASGRGLADDLGARSGARSEEMPSDLHGRTLGRGGARYPDASGARPVSLDTGAHQREPLTDDDEMELF